ncbi:helix-turn-helix domain-containing protein [Coraliomargarita parva]|uniref:helix-turn-helix domain-containing protein n=1 Tax=Coraliomargarita parva TaxID=3014050 RepID=UPI0022B3FEC2|nr:AraC family transcriptional regulator [Coraliomargarita parva]
MLIEQSGERIIGESGNWIFFDPMCPRAHRFEDQSEIVSIRFQIRWHGLDYLPPLIPVRVEQDEADSPLLRVSRQLCRLNPKVTEGKPAPLQAADYCHQQAVFYEWLSLWHQLRDRQAPETGLGLEDPRVFTIMDYYRDRISIQPIDFSALQQAVQLSRPQINRIFKSGTGLSLHQWLVSRCLDEAQKEIRKGKLSIKEIAAQLQFYDAAHMTRWFRTQTGRSPSEWRALQSEAH